MNKVLERSSGMLQLASDLLDCVMYRAILLTSLYVSVDGAGLLTVSTIFL